MESFCSGEIPAREAFREVPFVHVQICGVVTQQSQGELPHPCSFSLEMHLFATVF